MPVPTKVIGYIRVSTWHQSEKGVSLEDQRKRLDAYAVAMGLELVGVEVDGGLSAKDMARPGLKAALQALDAGKADGLLIFELARLTRSVRDLGDLLENYFASRFSLISVSDSIDTRTAAGRMVLNILTSVTQWEREATGERTKRALNLLKSQGVKLGLPYMKDAVGDSVKIVKELYETGNYTHRTLADELNRRNIQTARGGKWWPKTVRTALQSTI